MKSTPYVLAVGLVLALAGAITYFVVEPKPPKSVVTNYAQLSKGFWQNIRVNEGDGKGEISTPAFFCRDSGAYGGHIIDSRQGWWVVYNGDKKNGSYASEDFAKREVEDTAECK